MCELLSPFTYRFVWNLSTFHFYWPELSRVIGASICRYVDAMYLHCALGHCHVQIVEHLIGVLLLAVRLEGVPHRDGCLCVARPRSGCTPHGHRLRLCAAIVVCGGRHHGICGDAARYKKRQRETKLAGSYCWVWLLNNQASLLLESFVLELTLLPVRCPSLPSNCPHTSVAAAVFVYNIKTMSATHCKNHKTKDNNNGSSRNKY